MSEMKPIDKTYLIASLKEFDKNILSKKYTNGVIYEPKIGKVNVVNSIEKADVKVIVDNTNKCIIFDFDIPQGRSITALTTDNSDNIIITFSDGSEQNIGKLSVDIQADFLTSEGFGKLRYYDNKFQYYNEDLQEWVDTTATPDNVVIVNMVPNPMQFIMGIYDYEHGYYKLKWQEPQDTVVDGQLICAVEKVIIRRKLGEVPKDENDGDLVKVIERKDFGNQSDKWYADISFNPNLGDVYYYKAFPMSATGFYNYFEENETGGILAKDYELYGFIYDTTEPDPDSMFTPVEDNTRFRGMHMNYDTDVFNYGDWNESYIIKKLKPYVLGFDGNVLYELNKDNLDIKLDETPSNIDDETIEGNAMSGIPKTYISFEDLGDGKCIYRFSNKKLDDSYKCYAHHDANGNEIEYIYEPIFPGSLDSSGRLRSLSNKTPIANKTRQQEINAALLNNIDDTSIWYTEVYADRQLLNLLLILMGMSGNTQEVYGAGNSNSYVSASNTGIKKTGTMNQKGMFWGNDDNISGVKVFGIEHYWGNQWRALSGWINDKGMQKIKLTYGQEDGSTIDSYNLDGNGYIEIPNSTPDGTSGGYINNVILTEYGIIPVKANGSASTYLCDMLLFRNSAVYYALSGGSSHDMLCAGAFCSDLDFPASSIEPIVGAAPSCKPLAQTGGE